MLAQTDLLNFGSELQAHVALAAVLAFSDAHSGALPRPNDDADAAEVVQLAQKLLDDGAVSVGEGVAADAVLVGKFARHAAVELQVGGGYP